MYMRDVCLTLAAFLAASPAAGPLLLGSDAGLMSALAGVHDEFVPRLLRAAGRAPDVSVEPYSKVGLEPNPDDIMWYPIGHTVGLATCDRG